MVNAYGDQKLIVTMAQRDRRPSVNNEEQNPPITKNKSDDQNTPITMNHSGTYNNTVSRHHHLITSCSKAG